MSCDLGIYSLDQLVELRKELDMRSKSGDANGVNQIIRICQRIETKKADITKSQLGRLLFSVAKEWRESD